MAEEPFGEEAERSRRMIWEEERRLLRFNASAESTIPAPKIVVVC